MTMTSASPIKLAASSALFTNAEIEDRADNGSVLFVLHVVCRGTDLPHQVEAGSLHQRDRIGRLTQIMQSNGLGQFIALVFYKRFDPRIGAALGRIDDRIFQAGERRLDRLLRLAVDGEVSHIFSEQIAPLARFGVA